MGLVDDLIVNIRNVEEEEDTEALPPQIARHNIVRDVSLSVSNVRDIPDRWAADKHVHPVWPDGLELVQPSRERIIDLKLRGHRIYQRGSLTAPSDRDI